MAEHAVSPFVAIPAGFVVGGSIGAVIGFLVARIGIPAFVVTLAFFLGLQGIVLQIAREGGAISITNELIIAFVNRNIDPLLGWVLWAMVVAGYLGLALTRARGRRRAGLNAEPVGSIVIKAASSRPLGRRHVHPEPEPAVGRRGPRARGRALGRPVAGRLVARPAPADSPQRLGPRVYAIGGNIEAARRAGINVRGSRCPASS